MSDAMSPNAWLTNNSDGRRFAAAFLVGLLLEGGALALLLPVLTRQSPPPSDTQSIVKLSIIAPSPPAPPAPPPPKPKPVVQPPKPVVPPPPLPPPPPMPVAPPLPLPPPLPVAPQRPAIHHPRPHRFVPRPPPVQQPAVQAPPAPTPPTPPPPAAAPAAPSAGELELFEAEMRRAVQAAAVDPAAAEMSREAGVVRVEFTYQDGAASNIAIIGSSGFPLLDEAARNAVLEARYPPPPPDFAGHAEDIVVDVIFRPAAADVDGD